MCGIGGILALRDGLPPPGPEALSRMAGAMRHRGPDEAGAYADRRIALVHTRLSIVDLASGQQPLGSEDGRWWIAFNGEVFNHVELKEELSALGLGFRTRSDTEVALQAYRAWGDDAFSRFNGQWALAIWDAAEQELVLCRDRLGVRPLHVCRHQDRLLFASEVKAIFAADPQVPRALDPEGLAQTFTFWTVVAPRTAFRGVEEIEPGHVRRYRRQGEVRDRAWWSLGFPDRRAHPEVRAAEAAEALRSLVADATRLRTVRADVPVGSYLSGGLDSSLVAALARRAVSGTFHTFSLRFEDAELDETPFQREMAARLESQHHELVVSRRDVAEAFPQVVAHAERPILRAAPAPLFLLSRMVRERGIKVVLTGEGADELFAGYDLFREGKVRRFWARRPGSALRPRLLDRLYPYLSRSPTANKAMARQFFGADLDRWQEPGFAHGPRWRTTSALRRLFSAGLRDALGPQDPAQGLLRALPEGFDRWDPLSQDQYLEVRTLLSGYLLPSQGDRVAMAHSVEGRFPFLDDRVIAMACALPPRIKLCGLDEKRVLKLAGEGLVPPRISRRPKQPFRAPDAASFFGAGSPDWIDGSVSEAAVAEAGIFDPRAVRHLWDKCRRHPAGVPFSNSDNMAVVGVLSVQLLHQQFVRRAPEPPPITWTTLRGDARGLYPRSAT